METRRNTRFEEETKVMECKSRENKGKSMAKEEKVGEIYEIQDDTEEEEERYEAVRETDNLRREAGEMSRKRPIDEQLEDLENEAQHIRGRKRSRGVSSMPGRGNRGGRGQRRNRGGRGRG